jgi:hypothetical protein
LGRSDFHTLSRDRGDSFERPAAVGYVLAQRVDLDGRHLWFSSYAAGKPALKKVHLGGRRKAEEVLLRKRLAAPP